MVVYTYTMAPIEYLSKRDASLDLIRTNHTHPKWNSRGKRTELSKLRTATKERIQLLEKIFLHLRIGYRQKNVRFKIFHDPTKKLLLRTSCMEPIIGIIHSRKRKVVSWHSRQVAILATSLKNTICMGAPYPLHTPVGRNNPPTRAQNIAANPVHRAQKVMMAPNATRTILVIKQPLAFLRKYHATYKLSDCSRYLQVELQMSFRTR